jgi:hypothetical protein
MKMHIKVEYEDEKFEMKSGLFAGRLNDAEGSPTACYIGRIEPEDIHNALYYIHRSVIKIMVDQFDVPLSVVDDFLISALSRAVTQERAIRILGKSDLSSEKTVKFKNNHN